MKINFIKYKKYRDLMNLKRHHVLAGSVIGIIILGFIFFNPRSMNYNGKYIKNLSKNDKVYSMLIKDIKKFKGEGGGDIGNDLKIVIYKIKPGESLWEISKKTGLSIDTLLSINNLKNAHILQPGQEIRIPNKDGLLHKIEPGETLESIAKEFNVDKEDIINVNEISDNETNDEKEIFIPNAKFNLQQRINLLGRFIVPLFGRITSGFGWRRNPISHRREFHTGLDIANYYGAPIRAAESGRVIFVGRYRGYGKMIILRHTNGYSTRYAHLSKFRVKYGQYVRQGRIIGYVGTTGYTTGPHLHFEIRRYGKPLNPYFLIRWSRK